MLKAGPGQGDMLTFFFNQEQNLDYRAILSQFEEKHILNLILLVIIIMQLEHKQLSCGMHWIYIFDLLNASASRKISNIPTYFRISGINLNQQWFSFILPKKKKNSPFLVTAAVRALESVICCRLCFQARFSLGAEWQRREAYYQSRQQMMAEAFFQG